MGRKSVHGYKFHGIERDTLHGTWLIEDFSSISAVKFIL
jgi:hypothetical protein